MLTDTDRMFIWGAIPISSAIGLWGNINVIYAHYRLPMLRTKYGLLLCMLTFSQSICLLFEWVGFAYGVTRHIIRSKCFFLISPYLFMHCAQTGLMATISVDLFISIILPMKHRVVHPPTYLFFLCLPTLIYGTLVIVLAIIHTDDTLIQICNPPLSLPPLGNRVWYFGALMFGLITIATYTMSFSIMYSKTRNKSQSDTANTSVERKAMQSLSVLLVVFVVTRYIGVVIANLMNIFAADKDLIGTVQSYNVFSAMICYSSSYYVCFFRSSEYRKIFWYQIVAVAQFFGFEVNERRFGRVEVEITNSVRQTSTVNQQSIMYSKKPISLHEKRQTQSAKSVRKF